MTYFPVQSPYNMFTDTAGDPLESGYIYIGEANQNPITNPIGVSWDTNGLYPAAQPIRTIGGFPDRNGSPANIYIDISGSDDYSILIQDKNGVQVFYSASYIAEFMGNNSVNVDYIDDLRSLPSGLNPVYVRGHTTIGDGGAGKFEFVDGAAPGTYVDNNGTIIVPSGGDGSGAWVRQFDGDMNLNWFGVFGDGTTDETAAFQNAIDQLATDSVSSGLERIADTPAPALYIPPPSGDYYLITDEIELPKLPVIRGAGQSSIIRFVPTSSGKRLFKNAGSYNTWTIRDLALYGPGPVGDEVTAIGNMDCSALYIDNVGFGLFENLFISSFNNGNGIEISNDSYRCSFKNINIHNCSTGYRFGTDTLGAASSNSHLVIGGSVRNCGYKSDVVESGTDAEKYQWMTENAAVMLENARNINIQSVTFEGSWCAVCVVYRAANIKHDSCWREANCRMFSTGQSWTPTGSDASDQFNDYLFAANATQAQISGSNITISSYTVTNCHEEHQPLLHGASTRTIKSVIIDACYGSQRGPGFKIIDGCAYDLIIKDWALKNVDVEDINALAAGGPDVIIGTTGSDYPDDPLVICQYGTRSSTGRNISTALVAGTQNLVFGSSVDTRTNETLINVYTTDDADDIRDKFVSICNNYIPTGHTVTLQFEDGTHTWTQQLLFENVQGGGTINIVGNSSDNSLSTSKNVIIDGTAFNDSVIEVYEADVFFKISYLHIKTNSGSSADGIKFYYVGRYGQINYNYIENAGILSRDIMVVGSRLAANSNYLTGGVQGIFAQNSSEVFSNINDDTGTQPVTGLYAYASVIMKYSTQPSGSSANETTTRGGVIR